MSIKLLSHCSTPLVPLEEAKAYLRLSHDLDDGFVMRALHLATQWVEEATGKTLLTKTWAYTHENSTLILPHPPIQEILDVRSRRHLFTPQQYDVVPHRDTLKVEVPFYWGKRVFTVTYRAGFADRPQDIPLALQQAVLSTMAYIYENRGSEGHEPLSFQRIQPWIQYHRTFNLG